MPWLINAAQADKFRKSQKSLIILDASYHHPDTGRDAQQEFLENHILGAQFFDITEFSSPSPENHFFLDEKTISEKLAAKGIRNDYKIIFYDDSNLRSASRALWMMKFFGHNPNLLYIIDGGLAAWKKYGGKMETQNSPPTSKSYTAKFQFQFLRTLAQMKENARFTQEQVIDLRHPVFFAGGDYNEPGLRSGYYPQSSILPHELLFNKDGTFLPLEKIRRQLLNIALNLNDPMVAMSDDGVTAAILDFVLDLINHQKHAVYNGSWNEWGAETLYPGEKDLKEREVKTCLEELDPKHRFIP